MLDSQQRGRSVLLAGLVVCTCRRLRTVLVLDICERRWARCVEGTGRRCTEYHDQHRECEKRQQQPQPPSPCGPGSPRIRSVIFAPPVPPAEAVASANRSRREGRGRAGLIVRRPAAQPSAAILRSANRSSSPHGLVHKLLHREARTAPDAREVCKYRIFSLLRYGDRRTGSTGGVSLTARSAV